MKDLSLEIIAREILQDLDAEDLDTAEDKHYDRVRIGERENPGFILSTCVNLGRTKNGRIVIINHIKDNQFYDKLNESIRFFVGSRDLEVISKTDPGNCTTYSIGGDARVLVYEYEGREGNKQGLEEISFYEAECLINGLDPVTTTPHDLWCRKYMLEQEKISERELSCMKQGLDPEKTSDFQLYCAEYGLDPEVATEDELREFMNSHEPAVPGLREIYEERGEITEEEREMAVRRHFYNCEIDDATVREVNHLAKEFPTHYRQIIPLHFLFKSAVKEDDSEYAETLKAKIRSILPEDKILVEALK